MPLVNNTSKDSHQDLGFAFPKLLEITKQCAIKDTKVSCSPSIIAVVVAAAALESFISDLAALIEFGLKPHQELLGKLATELNRLENKREPLTSKYQATKSMLSGVPFDKGRPPFKEFQLLIRVRNQLVHPKADLFHSNKEGYVIGRNSNQEIVETLADKGLCEKPVRHRKEWFNYIENDLRVADWAYSTSTAMILEIFKVFPKKSLAWLVLHSKLRDMGLLKDRE